ncbi:error-prone DNA polymerase [Sphingorhabdus sp.]|jgi:error-prone DNA polymerase|uniref:error-prone DNA polymerase n=1 Tax=Sphingorhabdus sp. TaxID=1902408 RepID=UPI0037C9BC92
MSYAELACTSSYSFLRGASPPADYVAEGIRRGLTAIGIADRNTVSGVVRAWKALADAPDEARSALLAAKRDAGQPEKLTEAEEAACAPNIRFLAGSRLVFSDGTPDIIAYPATRQGWGNLTRLLTVGNMRATKGSCILKFDDLLDHLNDVLLIVMPYATADAEEAHKNPPVYSFKESAKPIAAPSHLKLVTTAPQDWESVLRRLAPVHAGKLWLGVSTHHRGKDKRQLVWYRQVANAFDVPLLATNDPLYATRDQRPLHDIITCIRMGTTIQKAGFALEANAERYIKTADDMEGLFHACPEAVAETGRFAAHIHFDLEQLKYEYPHEPVPGGWTPDDWLAHLVWTAAHERYGAELPEKIRKSIETELAFIRTEKFAYYFLTVHDLVKFARDQKPPILCQGRGSAANSTVCFLLGVTSVDPLTNTLLFSRFISSDRKEPPDIDVDFEHERREEVMQYIYRRYGRHRAAIAGTIIHYRPRSAVREVGKALGLTEDVTTRMVSTVWGSFGSGPDERRLVEAGFDPDNPEIARLKSLSEQLIKFPRHLSQHVGGFILTENRLDETVPIHNGAMKDRNFIEWDKDDIDALGLMKVDVLALGMLTCIRKAYDMMREQGIGDYDLKVDIDSDDPNVYDMLCRGESLGVFQVESRAQMNMLPRMKPRSLYDLTIQVAIVRPGPIQGDMVHPYLRRRNGEEKVEYPSPAAPYPQDELKHVLGKTLGVPLFQEQAMNLAITAAEFSEADANRLRKAMATFRNVGGMEHFETMMVEGMVRRGYERDFAQRCFGQIQGFGSYGFPESHALSFARLVYVSSWIKHYHPAIFAAALLNSQPMGFYAPAQIVRDAQENGVEVRPIDVNASHWDNIIEQNALRLGMRQIDGFREVWAQAIVAHRPFASIEDLARRAALPPAAVHLLADADAVRSLGFDRREGAWEARRTPSDELPLFAAANARELGAEADAMLPAMPPSEHVAADYQMTRLSLKGHPMQFLRGMFAREGVLSCAEANVVKNGKRVRVAGVVLVRQRPGKGNAIFITIEDESGVTNILLWARLFDRQRRAVMASRLIIAEGEIQRSKEGVVHLMATNIIDRTDDLARLSETHQANVGKPKIDEFARPHAPRGSHPRDVRILPKSRDFH